MFDGLKEGYLSDCFKPADAFLGEVKAEQASIPALVAEATMRHSLTFLLIFLPAITFGDDPGGRTPQEQFDTLLDEYKDASAAWEKSFPDPRQDPDGRLWIESYRVCPDWQYAPRFLALAEANPRDPVAGDAALTILAMNASTRDEVLFLFYIRARELIIHNQLEAEPVVRTILNSPTFVAGHMEPYFRALLATTRDRETQVRACMALVRANVMRLSVAARPSWEHPEDQPEYFHRNVFLKQRFDPNYIAYFQTCDVKALTQENEALLERVVRDAGDIPLVPAWSKPQIVARNTGRTLGDSAKAQLNRLRSLSPGKVAPEIVGEDIDGKPMKLSDYRGKVVVLIFWGAWSEPSLRAIRMGKAMSARLKDEPFAIVGVNSDKNRENVKEIVTREGITWRSWYDGGRTGGPIADRWNVQTWPSLIVIDQAGVIRFSGLPHQIPTPLDEAVDSLLVSPKS